jgi:shikimate dehydrogenase
MHEAAYAAAGIEGWRYQRLPVPPERFDETVRALPGAGFAGANVTLPHKEAALALADSATEAARAIGAANTLSFTDAGIEADNTDAPGFLAALEASVQGLRATVLGAGGSARAVVWALREAGAADVAVWNRTAERARALADELSARAVTAPESGDLLVNCTSVGLDPALDPFDQLPLTASGLAGWACVADLAYASTGATAFLRAAHDAGARTVDGLEVLVRQGALSFERWTGVRAPLDAMRAGAGVQARGQ